MMDLVSMLGFSDKSPYKHNPYLEINTPDGRISMADTSKNLIGIDEFGNIQKMMGKRKKPYQFKGNKVIEVDPTNPYKQQGGMTSNQMLQFLFDDEDEVKPPTVEEVVEEPNKDDNEIIREEILRNAKKQQDYDLAMEIAMTGSKVNPYDEDVSYSGEGNPYSSPTTNTKIGNPYSAPSTNLNADTYLKAIFGNEAGKTGIDPQNVKGTASGKYGIIKSGRKDIYNAFYKNDMTYTTFEKMYNSSPNFEYEVAKKLAQININNSKTAAEAIGRWYSPAHASTGQWNTVPRPDYGNKLTMSQYVNRALKNIK